MWRRQYSCVTSTVSIGGKHAIYTGTTLPAVAFSMRAYGRIRKVARTLADLAGHELLELADVAQAIQLRNLDGQYWR